MNQKIVEYKTVSSTYVLAVNNTVNKMISEGWQPYGSPTSSEYVYFQAMVKYEVKKTFIGGPK